MTHRSLRAVVGAVLLLAATVATAGPAAAGSQDGYLAIRGPGSVYSGIPGDGGEVSLAVAAGGTATYSLQVVNSGTELAQYNIRLTASGAQKVVVLKGSVDVSKLVARDDGYFTAGIAPAKAEVLTVKVTVPAGTPQGTFTTGVTLRSTDGFVLSYGGLITEVPGTGNTQADIYARQGNQLYVGGSLDQLATSAGVAKGASVTFQVKAQNDSSTPKAMGVFFDRHPQCGTFTVKDGSTDITDQFWNDGSSFHGYPTSTLKPGASKVLTVVYKRTAGVGCGPNETATFSTLSGFFDAYESVRINVPMARG